ncbi:hypothetical protein ACFLWT_00230 [Chloroflexota bacterium]
MWRLKLFTFAITSTLLAKLLFTVKLIYYKTPARFRCSFRPAILILWLTRILRVDLWIITGEEIASKQKLAIIYTGSEENKNFLIKLAFDSHFRESYIGKTWLWKIVKTVKERGYDCSLMVTEVPKVFRILVERKKCLYVPCWISGEVDISADISPLVKNKSLKSDLRKIRKNKLHFELTNDPPQFHNFYYNMYLPYATKVHGNRSVIMEYDFMKKEFRNCTLLLIKKEKEYIAGILLAYMENVVRLWKLGVKDGNSDYVKDGAIGALFCFSVHYLQQRGYQRVNFGWSRAFLEDGVLKYKKKWDPRILDTFEIGFLIKPLLKTAGVKGFFLNNPFIYMDKTRLNGAIFMESDQSISEKDYGRICKDYYLTGINKLVIYRFGEGDGTAREIIPSEYSDRITVCSAETLF